MGRNMADHISRLLLAILLSVSPQLALAQQGAGGVPGRGPVLDDRKLRDLKKPGLPDGQVRLPLDRLQGCTFHEDANLKGRSKRYTALLGLKPGVYERAVSYVGNDMNDRISSFECDNFCLVDLYTDRDFKGHLATNYNSSSNLNSVSGQTKGGFNDLVSSLKVKCHVF